MLGLEDKVDIDLLKKEDKDFKDSVFISENDMFILCTRAGKDVEIKI
jgi:predicted pyridoxine 5'-phosphate oxidase superfamily flavin-nucleotide-binding protein